jgi:hypothetical protein
MGTSDEKLRLLKEELQRTRAEQERQRNLREVEINAAKQRRYEEAQEHHKDIMIRLRAMQELLSEQRESQAQQREQMEQHHAGESRLHEDTLKQVSDVQAAVTSLRDEQRADWEQHAEEHDRVKAGGYLKMSTTK